MSDHMLNIVERAIGGDAEAERRIVDLLTPAIQKSVGGVLRRSLPRDVRGNVRQEVLELTQEVLLALFENGGKRLLQWDPDRGLSLPNYVELVSRNLVYSILRSRRRSPYTSEPVEPRDLEALEGHGDDPELAVSREELRAAVLDEVKANLTGKGRQVLERILDGDQAEEISRSTGLTTNAVYVWRTRITRLAMHVAKTITDELGASQTAGRRPAEAPRT